MTNQEEIDIEARNGEPQNDPPPRRIDAVALPIEKKIKSRNNGGFHGVKPCAIRINVVVETNEVISNHERKNVENTAKKARNKVKAVRVFHFVISLNNKKTGINIFLFRRIMVRASVNICIWHYIHPKNG